MEYVFLIEMDDREIELDSLSEEQSTGLLKKLNTMARESIRYTENEGLRNK